MHLIAAGSTSKTFVQLLPQVFCNKDKGHTWARPLGGPQPGAQVGGLFFFAGVKIFVPAGGLTFSVRGFPQKDNLTNK